MLSLCLILCAVCRQSTSTYRSSHHIRLPKSNFQLENDTRSTITSSEIIHHEMNTYPQYELIIMLLSFMVQLFILIQIKIPRYIHNMKLTRKPRGATYFYF